MQQRYGGLAGRQQIEIWRLFKKKWASGCWEQVARSVPGAAVRGDLGWRKLEERREGKKLMYMERGWKD